MNQALTASPRALDLAREVLSIEAAAVPALGQRLGDDFLRSLDIILSCEGRVIVSGMGKSGHIARKIKRVRRCGYGLVHACDYNSAPVCGGTLEHPARANALKNRATRCIIGSPQSDLWK